MRVGVIGLGAMGLPIAINLVNAGFQTVVWNRSRSKVRSVVAIGATEAERVEQALQCDVVLSTLFDDEAVTSVLTPDVLATAPAGTIHVCMSTISSSLAGVLVSMHSDRLIQYVAAPMFGRPDAAAAGKLIIATAGTSSVIDRIEPILGVLGKTWRIGDDPRIAHVAKISGNFMISCAIEAMAESAAVLSNHGGDATPFLAMLGETLFSSPIYKVYGGAIASGTSPGTPSGLLLPIKDNRLMIGEAAEAGIEMPLAQLMNSRMQQALQRGLGTEDWSIALSTLAQS